MTAAALTEEVIPFTAGDGTECNLIRVRGRAEPARGPVLLVHGAGVRANIFRAPSGRTLVDELVDRGHDVWLENWRASIDIPHNRWTLDQAAVFDHPRAVARIAEETGADEVRAVIHCQGSTSFMMSAVAGLLPQVTTIVSNAVSLHPVVPRIAKLKLESTIPWSARVMGYLNPQWGIREAPWVLPKALKAWVAVSHHECRNGVCKFASFTYGTGRPTLWRHENLNDATHEWLKGEFADVPLTFFEQILRCIRAGRLVSVEGHSDLPADFTAQPPATDSRFVLLAGERNKCFLPESQRRTFDFLERHAPRRHAFHVFRGYSHLDVFMGRHAARDVFPLIIDQLES
jgi:hypothetical protein